MESGEEVVEKKDRRELIAEAMDGAHNVDFEPEPEGFDDEGTEEPRLESEGDEPEAKAPLEAGKGEDKAPVVEPEAILPPAELDEEAKKEFEQLSPALKKSFSKRFYDMRRDYTQKTMELAQHRNRFQQLEQVTQAHAGRLARKGIRVEDAINNALAWDHFVEQEGANAALQWLEKHGYDPEELIEARDGGEAYSGRRQQAQLPPEVQREIEESRQFRQQLMQQQQSQTVGQIYSTIESFKASKPIFKDPSTAEQVEQAMTPIVKGLRESSPNTPHGELLERAYNYVVNGDERFRNLVNGAEKRKQIEAERDRSFRATRAASSVAGNGPGSGSPSSVPKGRRNIIAAALDGRLTI